ncbi:MAG TPA: GlsB/YeaQ/YmgE family stress response membrane protein [Saprospirales bacterium]|nr:GlsB/YeaQ/YmgE family stress response membrane protein [Saprospirales bacterium]
MEMNDLISTLLVGAVSGWLAGQIRQGFGFGLLGNIIVGILGAFFGNWLFRSVLHVSLGSSLISTIATAVIGALVLLFLLGLVKKK